MSTKGGPVFTLSLSGGRPSSLPLFSYATGHEYGSKVLLKSIKCIVFIIRKIYYNFTISAIIKTKRIVAYSKQKPRSKFVRSWIYE